MLLACHSRLSLDFFDSGLHTCTAVARLTLALAKLSCNPWIGLRLSMIITDEYYVKTSISVLQVQKPIRANNVRQTTSNCVAYMMMWAETVAGWGSDEVDSCLLQYIKFTNVKAKKHAIYSDNSAGPKNYRMIARTFLVSRISSFSSRNSSSFVATLWRTSASLICCWQQSVAHQRHHRKHYPIQGTTSGHCRWVQHRGPDRRMPQRPWSRCSSTTQAD